MIDNNDNLYFIEMDPRNGEYDPRPLLMATGEDMIAATVESAVGMNLNLNIN